MSTGGTESKSDPEEDATAHRELLLKVYQTAVEEYRFNVQLTWDRTKFFLLLSVTAIAAGIGLLRLALDNSAICLFLVAYFWLLTRLTTHGAGVEATGKKYYRQALLTMTLVQRELGLYRRIPDLDQPDLHLGLAVTPGQRDFRSVIFNREKRADKAPDAASVVEKVRGIFKIIIAIEWLGAAVCVGAAYFALPEWATSWIWLLRADLGSSSSLHYWTSGALGATP